MSDQEDLAHSEAMHTAAAAETGAVDTYMEHVIDVILGHGWAVQFVGTESDPDQAFSYTVGMPLRHSSPELWLATLGPKTAQLVLNATADAVVKGSELTPGNLIDCGLNFPIKVWSKVSVEEAEPFVATRLQDNVEVVQVLWPDPAGKYPDEDGYDHVEWPQRLLERVA